MYRLVSLAFCLLPLLPAAAIPGRYIVELSAEAPPRRHAAQVHAAHAGARRLLESLGARVLDCTDVVANAVLIELPSGDPARLERHPGVRRITPVWEVSLTLDRALPLHHVPTAWQLAGGPDNAGQGILLGLIDTGIDITHPGFQDPSLPLPGGFPIIGVESDRAYTNNKVLIARSYVHLLPRPDDASASDVFGHGTAAAMIAAGARIPSPLGTISGVAPKAYLASYKVSGTPGVNNGTTSDAILKAIDDAVLDGVAVLYINAGSLLGPLPDQNPLVEAAEQAAAAGVVVVAAAGNEGPGRTTVLYPAAAPSVIAAGASYNDRLLAGSAGFEDGPRYPALLFAGPAARPFLSAQALDLAASGGNGQGCLPLPSASLSGRIAILDAGGCYVDEKVANAAAAGAVAVVIPADYAAKVPLFRKYLFAPESPLPIPLLFMSHLDGPALRQSLSQSPLTLLTLGLTMTAQRANPQQVAVFSSRGPTLAGVIKPDLVAVGMNVFTATQTVNPRSDLYDPSGFLVTQGTSFSGPLAAGAAAVLLSARPGLRPRDYRSLLINTASPLTPSTRVMDAGAGSLNLQAALKATIAASPTSLTFGFGPASPNVTRTLTVTNLSPSAQNLTLTVEPREASAAPTVSAQAISLPAGASADLRITFAPGLLDPGDHDGFLRLRTDTSELGVPYWYGATSATPRHLEIVAPLAPTLVGLAILFRVTDATGFPLRSVTPRVTALSGASSVFGVYYDSGAARTAWAAYITLDDSLPYNVFRIEVGELSREITIPLAN